MRTEQGHEHSNARLRVPRWVALPLLAVLAALLWMPPATARANDEFERAFKFELGRIAAHEAVHAGKHVLGEILFGHPGYYGPAPVPAYGPYPAYVAYPAPYYGPPVYYGQPYKHRGHHRHHHVHHHYHHDHDDCDHGW
jgi:hypothetical protein